MPKPKHILLTQAESDEPVVRPKSSQYQMPATGTKSARSSSRGKSRLQKYRDSAAPDHNRGNGKRIPVPTKHRDNAQRSATKNRNGALRRLGLTPAQCHNLASISHLLAYADGGIPAVLCALRLADSPDAGQFLATYDSLSETDRARVSIEEVALAAGIGPKRLLELAVSALVEDSQSLGKIIAASYHPKVIQSTAECAYLFPDNQSDRKLFLSGTGYVPQPANRAGGVFVSNTINLPPVPVTAGSEEAQEDGPVFNAAEDDLQRLHSTLDGAKMLEAPKTIENASQVAIGHTYKDSDSLECIPVPVRK